MSTSGDKVHTEFGPVVRTIVRGDDVIVQIFDGLYWKDRQSFHRISDDACWTNANDAAVRLANKYDEYGNWKP